MKKKTNLLLATQYLEMGGLETLIMELCNKLDQSRFNIRVLCFNGYDEAYKRKLLQQGIPVSLIRKRHRFDFGFFKEVTSFLKKEKIEILHSHGGCFFYSAIFKKMAGIKIFLYTIHGMPLLDNLQIRIEDRISVVVADRIIAVSEEIKEFWKNRFSIPDKKLYTIINGVNTDVFVPIPDCNIIKKLKKKFHIPQGRKIIGSVGRLDEIKNYPLFLRAFTALFKEHGRVSHLVFIGDGIEKDRLKNDAQKLGISEHVTFVGVQYHVEEILPMLDIFVLSSRTEGTSIALLEAQSCGIPAVVTDVGGNPNIVSHGYNGFLCKPDDAKDMAAKLSLLLEDKLLMAQIGKNARTTVLDRFNLSDMVRKYELLYESFISE